MSFKHFFLGVIILLVDQKTMHSTYSTKFYWKFNFLKTYSSVIVYYNSFVHISSVGSIDDHSRSRISADITRKHTLLYFMSMSY